MINSQHTTIRALLATINITMITILMLCLVACLHGIDLWHGITRREMSIVSDLLGFSLPTFTTFNFHNIKLCDKFWHFTDFLWKSASHSALLALNFPSVNLKFLKANILFLSNIWSLFRLTGQTPKFFYYLKQSFEQNFQTKFKWEEI